LSRTEYFREYRKKNPEKIWEIKKRYYDNHPEKHREWSRDYYHRTKNESKKGKLVAIAGRFAGRSATTMYKVKVISTFAKRSFIKNSEKNKLSIHRAFLIIDRERKQAYNRLALLMVKENTINPTKSKVIQIFKKYPNLKCSF